MEFTWIQRIKRIPAHLPDCMSYAICINRIQRVPPRRELRGRPYGTLRYLGIRTARIVAGSHKGGYSNECRSHIKSQGWARHYVWNILLPEVKLSFTITLWPTHISTGFSTVLQARRWLKSSGSDWNTPACDVLRRHKADFMSLFFTLDW